MSKNPSRASSVGAKPSTGKPLPMTPAGPCSTSAEEKASAWMADVSFSFSAASAAMAKVGPRPITNSDCAAVSARPAAARGGGISPARGFRAALRARRVSSASSRPMRDERNAGDERGDHRLGRGDRALGAGAQRQHGVGVAGERRVLVVDQRDRRRGRAPWRRAASRRCRGCGRTAKWRSPPNRRA